MKALQASTAYSFPISTPSFPPSRRSLHHRVVRAQVSEKHGGPVMDMVRGVKLATKKTGGVVFVRERNKCKVENILCNCRWKVRWVKGECKLMVVYGGESGDGSSQEGQDRGAGWPWSQWLLAGVRYGGDEEGVDPSEKSIEIMRKFSEQFARKSGTYFCVDKSVTAVVIKGLAEHKDTLGAPLCPCRHYDDKKAEAAQGFWNCPCVPMRERQECHCMLFLTPDNDFAGKEQEITLDEIREATANM
ncbi:hypothetical protein KSS87_014514 [Heliosperma pusillum]|nr:hypothetical protein KSS87_014514 [Heliosperma pusillum]